VVSFLHIKKVHKENITGHKTKKLIIGRTHSAKVDGILLPLDLKGSISKEYELKRA
jgi:hypothetical protein